MSTAHVLETLAPSGLDPALWDAALDLAGARSLVARSWDLSVVWEETPAPFAAVARFFHDEQTAFPRLPLGDMSGAADAEERSARRYRIGGQDAAPLHDDDDLRAPWLALYLVTASGASDRALVGTVCRGAPPRADAALEPAYEQPPDPAELAASLAEAPVDRERTAILARERDGSWIVEEPIRGC